jgi:Fic family protein
VIPTAAADTARPPALGRMEEHTWPGDPNAYEARVRRGGRYAVFIPASIAERDFSLDSRAVGAIAHAQGALARLNATPPGVAALGALARNLLRSESAASSRIEGLHVSQRRLARAAYQGSRSDARAAEVLGNIHAMERAIELGADARALTVGDIRDIHRTLLRFSEDAEIAGVIRTKQNWIGGNDFNPVGAAYVPPPPDQVPDLLEDLCRFINRDDLAPVAQAAIAHAQYENIHPFADGNGRTGRALIYTVLRRRGEAANYIPPISLVLAAEPKAYVGGLGAYSQGKVSLWCQRFAAAVARASERARELAAVIQARQVVWLDALGQPRSDSAARQLVAALPAQPVIDVATGQKATGKSHVAVGNAIAQLEHARILKPLGERRWGRVWECDELLDLVTEFEKQVSTP